MPTARKFRAEKPIALKALGPRHAQAMAGWMQDADLRDNLGLRSIPTLASTKQWLEQNLAGEEKLAFAILWGDEHVGNLIFDKFDSHLGTARLHVYLGEVSVRGQGVGTQAIRLGLEKVFRERGCHKVWLTVHEKNTAAIKTYESVGFRKEGLLREEFIYRGQRLNSHYMGILASEWSRASNRSGS